MAEHPIVSFVLDVIHFVRDKAALADLVLSVSYFAAGAVYLSLALSKLWK
jgi:hypothetical protein